MRPTARHVAALLFLLVVCGAAHADDPTPTPVPPAVLEAVADTYDAGRVEVGARVTHTYELRNRGTQPLEIAVKTSCGCTTTDYDQTIPPGGTGKVSAALDTTHMRGHTVKTIRVTSSDPSQTALVLTMIVDPHRPLDVAPSDAPYLRGPSAALTPIDLTVTAPDGSAFAIVRIEDDPTLVASRIAKERAAPKAKRTEHHLVLTPNRDLAVGTYSPTITLLTNHPKAERFEIRPVIVVSGPLTTMPPQLLLREGAPPMTVRVYAADDRTAFRVLRVDATDTDFTATFAAVDEHNWDVTVRYTGPPDRRGPVHAALKVATDAPQQPLLLVRISGNL